MNACAPLSPLTSFTSDTSVLEELQNTKKIVVDLRHQLNDAILERVAAQKEIFSRDMVIMSLRKSFEVLSATHVETKSKLERKKQKISFLKTNLKEYEKRYEKKISAVGTLKRHWSGKIIEMQKEWEQQQQQQLDQISQIKSSLEKKIVDLRNECEAKCTQIKSLEATLELMTNNNLRLDLENVNWNLSEVLEKLLSILQKFYPEKFVDINETDMPHAHPHLRLKWKIESVLKSIENDLQYQSRNGKMSKTFEENEYLSPTDSPTDTAGIKYYGLVNTIGKNYFRQEISKLLEENEKIYIENEVAKKGKLNDNILIVRDNLLQVQQKYQSLCNQSRNTAKYSHEKIQQVSTENKKLFEESENLKSQMEQLQSKQSENLSQLEARYSDEISQLKISTKVIMEEKDKLLQNLLSENKKISEHNKKLIEENCKLKILRKKVKDHRDFSTPELSARKQLIQQHLRSYSVPERENLVKSQTSKKCNVFPVLRCRIQRTPNTTKLPKKKPGNILRENARRGNEPPSPFIAKKVNLNNVKTNTPKPVDNRSTKKKIYSPAINSPFTEQQQEQQQQKFPSWDEKDLSLKENLCVEEQQIDIPLWENKDDNISKENLNVEEQQIDSPSCEENDDITSVENFCVKENQQQTKKQQKQQHSVETTKKPRKQLTRDHRTTELQIVWKKIKNQKHAEQTPELRIIPTNSPENPQSEPDPWRKLKRHTLPRSGISDKLLQEDQSFLSVAQNSKRCLDGKRHKFHKCNISHKSDSGCKFRNLEWPRVCIECKRPMYTVSHMCLDCGTKFCDCCRSKSWVVR